MLVAFAGWMAQQESSRRSERIRAGLERRRAEGKPVGRQPGSTDNKPRRRSGYVASWESGRRRAAQDVRAPRREPERADRGVAAMTDRTHCVDASAEYVTPDS